MFINQTYRASCIYIIIVNWNNYKDTIDCLTSLVDIIDCNIKILLINNGSTDSSLQKIIEWADGRKLGFSSIDEKTINNELSNDSFLIVMSLNTNHGFSGANNLGVRFAQNNKADYVLLLNNDTVMTDNLLSNMMKTAMRIQDAGIVSCTIKYYDDQDKIWFSGGDINFVKGAFYHRNDDCTGERETDFVTGCLMLIPAGVFKKVGYFDERYFLNVEDIDFSCRVKAAGYKLVVNCDAEIYHKVSSSIGGLYSSRNQYYFHRNRMLFFSMQLSGAKKVFFFIFQFIFAIPAWMIIQLARGNMQAIKGAMLGYADYLRSNFGKSRYF